MRRRVSILASMVLVLAGCRDLGLSGRLFACSGDGECGAGTTCHPIAKVCVAPDADVSWLIDSGAAVPDLPEDEGSAPADDGTADPGVEDPGVRDLVETGPDLPDAVDIDDLPPDDVPSIPDTADPGGPEPDESEPDPGMDTPVDAGADEGL